MLCPVRRRQCGASAATIASTAAFASAAVSGVATRVWTPNPNVFGSMNTPVMPAVAFSAWARSVSRSSSSTVSSAALRAPLPGCQNSAPWDPASQIAESSACSAITRRSWRLRPETRATVVSGARSSASTASRASASMRASIGSSSSGERVPSKSRATSRTGVRASIETGSVIACGSPWRCGPRPVRRGTNRTTPSRRAR